MKFKSWNNVIAGSEVHLKHIKNNAQTDKAP